MQTPVQAETDVIYRSTSLLRPISPVRSTSPVRPDVRSESPVLVMTPSGPEVIMPELHFQKLEEKSSKTELTEKSENFSSKSLLAEWNRNVILLIKGGCNTATPTKTRPCEHIPVQCQVQFWHT